MNNAAAWAHLHPPVWSRVLFFTALAIMFGELLISFFVDNPRIERRLYWSSWIGGGVLLGLSLLFRGWQAVAAVFALVMFGAVVYAYFNTSYLKIGGRIYALRGRDSRPDPPEDGSPAPAPIRARDAYIGDISAAKFWWLLVALAGLLAGTVLLGGWIWQATAFAVLMVVVSAVCGIDDATRRLPIARGQHIQAFIAAVLSIPVWGVPAIVYLLGYQIGRRWPMGYGLRDPVARHYRHLDEPANRHEATDPGNK
jgi:hypothetical protein